MTLKNILPTLFSRIATIASIVFVTAIAIVIAYPQRALDWDGTIVPLARRFAGITTEATTSSAEQQQQPLKGKYVVITGCTNGIGLSLTRALSKLGATVIGIGRSKERLQKLQQEIPTVQTVVADFKDLSSVSKAADEIVQRWDHIDILINNAGMHDHSSNFWGDKTSVQGYDRVFTVNYLSHFLLTEKLSKIMFSNQTQNPTLVQISSSFHWLTDGSDLIPTSPNDMPIAARPGGSTGFYVLRSSRSYANSKLAQIYHARALKRKHPLWSQQQRQPKQDSDASSLLLSPGRTVSICPGWVATNIAGEPFGRLLAQVAFPSDGWGIASSLVATLDVEHNLDHDFYHNTKTFGLLRLLFPSAPPAWFYKSGLRDVETWALASLALFIEHLRPVAMYTKSSPESYNPVIADALYDWSYQAIKEYL